MIRLISLLALCAAVSAKNTNTLLRQQTQGQAQAAVSEQAMVDPLTLMVVGYAVKKGAEKVFVRYNIFSPFFLSLLSLQTEYSQL